MRFLLFSGEDQKRTRATIGDPFGASILTFDASKQPNVAGAHLSTQRWKRAYVRKTGVKFQQCHATRIWQKTLSPFFFVGMITITKQNVWRSIAAPPPFLSRRRKRVPHGWVFFKSIPLKGNRKHKIIHQQRAHARALNQKGLSTTKDSLFVLFWQLVG